MPSKRTFILTILLVLAGASALLVLFIRLPRSLIELKLVSSKSLGAMNGKEFLLVTLSIKNRTRDTVMFERFDDIQAKVKGDWIEVCESFSVPNGFTVEDIQKRFVLPRRAEAFRLRCKYRLIHFQPVTRVGQLILRSGSTAHNLVAKIPWHFKQVWPEGPDTSLQEINLEVKIPPTASQPVVWYNPLAVDPLIAPAIAI